MISKLDGRTGNGYSVRQVAVISDQITSERLIADASANIYSVADCTSNVLGIDKVEDVAVQIFERKKTPSG